MTECHGRHFRPPRDCGASRHRRAGFTLIELLVVLRIITLIVAITFPVFVMVREHARRALCMSNLHQWGAILEMYAQAEKRYPVGCFEAGTFGGYTLEPSTEQLADTRAAYGPVAYDMREGVKPYVSDWRIAFCPSIPPNFDINALPTPLPSGVLVSSYSCFYGKVYGRDKLLRPGGSWTDATGHRRNALMSDIFYFDVAGGASGAGITRISHPGPGIGGPEYQPPAYAAQNYILARIAPPPKSYGATLFTDGSVRGAIGPSLVGVDPAGPPGDVETFYMFDE